MVGEIERENLVTGGLSRLRFVPDCATKTHTVYLSGPMSAINWEQAQEWRDYVAEKLGEAGIRTYSPLRGKEFLSKLATIGDYDTSRNEKGFGNGFAVDSAILARDHNDVCVADLVFVNLWGATEKSLGTIAEYSWAYDRQIPAVGLWEGKQNPHNHPFTRRMIPFLVESEDFERGLHEAVELTKTILLG